MKKFIIMLVSCMMALTIINAEASNPKQQSEQGLGKVSSRNDFPSVLSGTTWVSSNKHIKLVFSGNRVTRYYSKPRWNYDDPVIWYNPGPDPTINYPENVLYFDNIQEPKKGVYKFQYREGNGKGGTVDLEVKGGKLYEVQYKRSSIDGGSHLLLERIK